MRVKNIHHELTEDDLKSLFEKVADIEFVKFDPNQKSVAYVEFKGEDDNIRESIKESIKRFDGKKAMGKILIVEDTKKKTLLDRIKPKHQGRNRNDRNRQRNDHGKARTSAKPNHRKPKRIHKTAEQLDAELNDYMNQ